MILESFTWHSCLVQKKTVIDVLNVEVVIYVMHLQDLLTQSD